MARHPKVRIIPPRKLNVSKCLSGGGTTVGDMVVVGCTVVTFGVGTVVGNGVLVILGVDVEVGTVVEDVVVLGDGTVTGGGDDALVVVDVGAVVGGTVVEQGLKRLQQLCKHI